MSVGYTLAPSILAANFAELGREIATLEQAGAHAVHFDVMDGHFVPHTSFDLPALTKIRPVTPLPFDIHLMMLNPLPFLEKYAKIRPVTAPLAEPVTAKKPYFFPVPADYAGVHWETVSDMAFCLKKIRALGLRPSVAVNPSTPVEDIFPIAEITDRVIIMSVEPGLGGQRLMPETLRKAEKLAKFAIKQGLNKLEIEMDGGINIKNLRSVLDAGVNVVVAGTAVITDTPEETVRRIKAFLDIMHT
jgi:ribulose-phosphate 3-epimerase